MKKLKIVNIGWANSIHVERLMRWLAGRGHDVSIITNAPKEITGVKVYDIRRKPDDRPRLERYKEFRFNLSWKWLLSLNEIVRIRKLVNEISPDIIHSHSLWYPGYLGVYIKGYPFVITVLNGDVLWQKGNLDIYAKWRTIRGLKKADLITGESQELMNACVKHGADEKKVHITRNWGVDFELFNCNGSKIEIRRNLDLPEDSKIVLSPRNIGPFYNVDKIVKAIPGVTRAVQDVKFIFIWHAHNKEREEKLNNLALRLGVKEFIRNEGVVSHDKVALYHKASDVMVSVSTCDSGPMALQEAMACGDVPVISELPSVREWITDGWNGILVDPNNVNQIADSVIELLKDDSKRKTFAERNWKLIQEKGDQDYWMEKMEELYYSLVVKEARG